MKQIVSLLKIMCNLFNLRMQKMTWAETSFNILKCTLYIWGNIYNYQIFISVKKMYTTVQQTDIF